jgi:NADH-quinone oxidoreductase subunit H
MIDLITSQGQAIFGSAWTLIWILVRAVVIVVPVLLCVAYLILWERKLIGWMHVRIGPNRVGPLGLLQPIADVLKLLLKEVMFPAQINRMMYLVAPLMVLVPAVAVWAVIPFQAEVVMADVNAGLLYVMAISSVGVYGVILAGWASNSKYAFIGAMRAAAQMVSYEIAMGFALVTVLMVAGSLNLSAIVNGQNVGYFADMGINILSWNWLPLLPMFAVYFISGVAETNRHPFDVVEGESEIVAGHMIEYSGMTFALFFLAEYINMIIISTMTSLMFLGGWAPPFSSAITNAIPGFFWLLIKVFLLLSVFIWIRAWRG